LQVLSTSSSLFPPFGLLRRRAYIAQRALPSIVLPPLTSGPYFSISASKKINLGRIPSLFISRQLCQCAPGFCREFFVFRVAADDLLISPLSPPKYFVSRRCSSCSAETSGHRRVIFFPSFPFFFSSFDAQAPNRVLPFGLPFACRCEATSSPPFAVFSKISGCQSPNLRPSFPLIDKISSFYCGGSGWTRCLFFPASLAQGSQSTSSPFCTRLWSNPYIHHGDSLMCPFSLCTDLLPFFFFPFSPSLLTLGHVPIPPVKFSVLLYLHPPPYLSQSGFSVHFSPLLRARSPLLPPSEIFW